MNYAYAISVLRQRVDRLERELRGRPLVRTVTDATYLIPTAGAIERILIDSSNNNVTLTLPEPFEGRQLHLKRTSRSNTVTVNPNRSETIEAATSLIITGLDSIMLVSDGTNWWVI